MKYAYLDPGPIITSPLRKAHLLRERVKQKDIRIKNYSYFRSASDSSSCVVVGGKLDTDIAPSS
jgi:hypothetical protein